MRKRNIQLNFRVTEAERDRIRSRMKQADIRSQTAFLRKMAIDGYIVSLDLPDIREMVRLLRISSNNLNQYAKKANQTGSIYETDIMDLKVRQEDLWEQTQKILTRLASIS
jgi:hypothetical protein